MYHLKLVGRQIFQRKGYFVINTIGLAVALTASVFIYTFLVKEWQTNTFHENVDHIYRITVQTDRNTHWGSEVCSSLGEIAKAELPEVADYTRIITARSLSNRDFLRVRRSTIVQYVHVPTRDGEYSSLRTPQLGGDFGKYCPASL